MKRRPEVVIRQTSDAQRAADRAATAAAEAYVAEVLRPVVADLARPDNALRLVEVLKAFVRALARLIAERIGAIDTASVLLGVAAIYWPVVGPAELKALRFARAEAELSRRAA